MSEPKPTLEEIQRVREHECSEIGHDWDVLEIPGREIPVAIVCSNCGIKAKVEDPSAA